MFLHRFIAGGLLVALPLLASAASDAELAAIRAEIEALRQQYETRIAALEARLAEAERQRPAEAAPVPSGAASVAAFNPAVSLILAGTYANLQRDPASWRLDGFVPGGQPPLPRRSFSLADSELVLSANVDPYLRGDFVMAVAPDDSVAVENAYLQTLALPRGFGLKAGRFYSGVGYLNEQHAHAWDFADAPLAQQAFLGGQYAQDGVQLKWLAPTDTFLELSAEAGRGQRFPGTERDKNGFGSWALGGRVGGDVGTSHAWLAGLGYLHTRPRDRGFTALDPLGVPVENTFDGRSDLWLASLVWKWAPEGNATRRNFKFQAEYFRRREQGTLTHDPGGAAVSDGFDSQQSGWYAQGVYQFLPRWRVGLRHDRLDAGRTEAGANAGLLPLLAPYDPHRTTVMLDYSPSEYSRLRFQLARDASRRDAPDTQLLLQYVLSLGAHGAHQF